MKNKNFRNSPPDFKRIQEALVAEWQARLQKDTPDNSSKSKNTVDDDLPPDL